MQGSETSERRLLRVVRGLTPALHEPLAMPGAALLEVLVQGALGLWLIKSIQKFL